LNFAIHAIRVCFHLDQQHSKSHLVNVILSEGKNLGSNAEGSPTDVDRDVSLRST